jgi:uncharacterized protein (DUF305 family)
VRLRLGMFLGLVLLLSACAGQQAAIDDHNGTSGSDHGGATSGAPYDAQFIDGMTIHHQGAVQMAEQALQESERPEIRELAENIIATQNTEIEQMAAWREQWFPDLAATDGTGAHMGDMELSGDTSIPFDQRFISAMIGHHNGAIEMAREAQTAAERAEIKQLAGEIIRAQEAEVQQLREWQTAWFGQ